MDLKNSKPVVFETMFFPPIVFFQYLMQGRVIVEKHENYQKRSFRNKCIIATAQGVKILTVPLRKGKHEQQKITEVQISYEEDWRKNQLKSIRAAYGKAPFFEDYFPVIENVYNSSGKYLFDLNNKIILLLQDIYCYSLPEFSEKYIGDYGVNDRRNHYTLKSFQEEKDVPEYAQVFEDRHGFLPNLSILDLLFCYGPEGRGVLGR